MIKLKGVEPKIGVLYPQNGWLKMENSYFSMDDLGGKPTNFRQTSIKVRY